MFLKKNYVLVLILVVAAILRFYKLGSVPPALYWDEASLGYNAYSILKTAHDEHQKFMPLTNFAAFGDYKPPLYIYAAVPSIAVFGPTEFAIRFPSAFFGFLTVILTYLLSRKIFARERPIKIGKLQISIPALAAFLMAISPWHLQLSRAAFEANLGLFFSLLGIYLFFKFAENRSIWLLPSLLSFIAAMYTFTGQRLFVPFILFILFLQFWRPIIKNLKIVIPSLIISAFIFYPLFIFATQTIEGRLRFEEVTIFRNLEPINESIRDRQVDDFSWWANILHNRRFYITTEYLTHYFDAFNPRFLFTRGDGNPRLSIQEVGELYYFEGFLALIGIYFLFKKRPKYYLFIIGWLLVSPLGPATARETPHALRMIHILPTFQMIAAYGFFNLYEKFKHKKIFLFTSVIIVLASLTWYLVIYYVNYPKNYSSYWQYGYKQAVEAIKPLYDEADQIIITKSLGRPYIYLLLYNSYDPKKFWQSAKITQDKFYFLDVTGFDKYEFTDDVLTAPVHGKVVYVSTGPLPLGARVVKEIKDLSGKTVFYVAQK